MQAIGQLMLDIESTDLSSEDKALLRTPEVGGVILFGRNVENPEQVRELTDSIRAIKPNVLISVDQEGGRVARLRDGFSSLPAMGDLGAMFESDPINALELAYATGYLMASEVLAVGIDFSFAPVLDINGLSRVIGDRAFHPHPVVITALSAEFMRGMKSAGMATTGKHFPGHGSVEPDSHLDDATDERSYEDIHHCDMQPFIRNLPWLDALMPAHVVFSQIDDKPAGFSSVWLQQIIRGKMGFTGVLFSDDLSMKAAHVAGNAGDRIATALTAGCDMGLVCNDRPAALIALERLQQQPDLLTQPSQTRLANMRGNIRVWRNNLEETVKIWPHWQTSQRKVMNAFFS